MPACLYRTGGLIRLQGCTSSCRIILTAPRRCRKVFCENVTSALLAASLPAASIESAPCWHGFLTGVQALYTPTTSVKDVTYIPPQDYDHAVLVLYKVRLQTKKTHQRKDACKDQGIQSRVTQTLRGAGQRVVSPIPQQRAIS